MHNLDGFMLLVPIVQQSLDVRMYQTNYRVHDIADDQRTCV